MVSLTIWLFLAIFLTSYLLGFMIDLHATPAHWPDYRYPVVMYTIVLLGMVVIHEGLHAVAARVFGLQVSFGIKWYGAVVYTCWYGGRITRWQRAIIILAPVVIITAACFITYAVVPSPDLMVLALAMLVSNTICSANDLRSGVALLRVPYGTVFEIPDGDFGTAIYEPKDYAITGSSELTTRASTLPAGELPRDPRVPLGREFNHWMNDLWTAASNRRLRSTARVYGQFLWRRLSRWALLQTPSSIQIHR